MVEYSVPAGLAVRKKGKQFGKQLALGPFQRNPCEAVMGGKIVEKGGNVALGLFVGVGVLDVEDDAVSRTLKDFLDLGKGIGNGKRDGN